MIREGEYYFLSEPAQIVKIMDTSIWAHYKKWYPNGFSPNGICVDIFELNSMFYYQGSKWEKISKERGEFLIILWRDNEGRIR